MKELQMNKHLRGKEALRFNKVHIRKCEFEWQPTDVLEVFYSIWGKNWVAQVKDFIEENRKAIIRDLRQAIKLSFKKC